ncbi:MAG: hypothetical protein DI596_11290 [Azospira oryzae]|nr:MAG: hypothetical protein DI596_11290 [Azospira oryzae]PZP78017.1 MAG: hypothetical protein DI593_11290 [Azospira oryzae]
MAAGELQIALPAWARRSWGRRGAAKVMTARPGRIKSIIRIDLPHPRDSTSDQFRDVERRIYADLDEELAKTFALEGRSARE